MLDAKFELDGHSLITPTSIAAEFSSNVKDGEPSDHEQAWKLIDRNLEEAAYRIERGLSATQTIDFVTRYLHEQRRDLPPAVWGKIVPLVQQHRLASFFLQDPLTKWSWDKPRGYSGDAHLLDLIYRHPDVQHQIDEATPLGRELFEYTSNAPSSQANRDRREILARYVDLAADANGQGTEVLSIAAGHLREADCSVSLKDGRLARWAALDQDPESVATIKRDYGGDVVTTINGSVRDILTKKVHPGLYDHVYASGLYDYLTEKVAVKLTSRALEFVKPGGTFLFANYSYPILVDGYLETFMNWALVLRSAEDMETIIAKACEGMDIESDVFFGENKNLVYGVIRKR